MNTGLLHVLLLLFAVLIVRLPSFFFSVFDWDESTFIIMGQSILNGNIPYVDAWDIKPPLAYYVYALFIAVFGKSVLSIRLGGALCVYAASILIYKTGQALNGRIAGLIAAVFLVVFTSTGPSGLSTMTEHILLVPVSLILYILFTFGFGRKEAFLAGFILGGAILIKTSMVFESLAVLSVVSAGFLQPQSDFSERVKRCAILSAGIFLPVLIMVYYYFAKNNLDLLFKTNVVVLNYIGAAASFQEKFEILLRNIGDNIRLNPLLWITSFLGALSLIFLKKIKTLFLSAGAVIFGAQLVSLFFAGQPFGYHYLITTMPILCLVSGLALSAWLPERRPGSTMHVVATVLLIVAGLCYSLQGNVGRHYKEIVTRLVQKQPLLDDSCYRIARFLEMNNARNHYVYMVNSCHIASWLSGSMYPTKYVHPSNVLIKEYMLKIIDGPDATKEKELLAILDKRPLFIIHRKDLWPRHQERFQTILELELQAHYDLVKTVDTSYAIFKRRNDISAQ
jgi:4-amino-4-deoxy-L-arabinose transferase-like glycosyltransferase